MPGGLFGFGFLNFDAAAASDEPAPREPAQWEERGRATVDEASKIRVSRAKGPKAMPTPAVLEAPESNTVDVVVTPDYLRAIGNEPIAFG